MIKSINCGNTSATIDVGPYSQHLFLLMVGKLLHLQYSQNMRIHRRQKYEISVSHSLKDFY